LKVKKDADGKKISAVYTTQNSWMDDKAMGA
jgi:hypothetical protein